MHLFLTVLEVEPKTSHLNQQLFSIIPTSFSLCQRQQEWGKEYSNYFVISALIPLYGSYLNDSIISAKLHFQMKLHCRFGLQQLSLQGTQFSMQKELTEYYRSTEEGLEPKKIEKASALCKIQNVRIAGHWREKRDAFTSQNTLNSELPASPTACWALHAIH